ncbi:helix-turn-helix transcriptional regulator [Sphingobium sp. SA2]|uniref:AraC family transcriptional regulator n=1 Tax=Sphingobium sp. SA2 TaxID=1524832 RepID=UPI0028BF7B85|nr:helix-turn-helix transcriptional regulator [Sphingobium sp. SA2]MDT7532016.1 helix-turn-helix transcriptional regulator [Sphingobium sp. SA2]
MSQNRQTHPAENHAPLVGLASDHAPSILATHVHDDRAQLMYAVRGMMNVTTPAGRWILPTGSALWIAAGTQHGLAVRRPVSLHNLYIKPGMTGVPGWRGCTVVNVSPLLRQLIASSIALPWDYAPASAESRLAHVLVDQLAAMAQAPVDLPEPLDPRAVRLAQIVRDDVTDRRPLSILAPLAGASMRTAERLFASETGMSFGMWRTRHRLMTAIELLAEGDSVAATSFAVGYDNPSSFIAAFRAMFSKTPGTYFDETSG